ncbi:hypothetical protein ACVWWO_002232 [Bradyrhizobium sp. F1.13.1]
MIVLLLQEPGFEHGLGQFLYEEWHAISTGEYLIQNLLRERLAGSDPLDQRRSVATVKSRQRERRNMRMTRPGRREFRSRGDEQQHPKPWYLFQGHRQELERSRVRPMDILNNDEHWLQCCQAFQLSQ